MSRRLRLPTASREEIAYRNALARHGGAAGFKLPTGEWQVSVHPRPRPGVSRETRLLAEWGGARYELAVPATALAQWLRHFVPEAEIAGLDEPLRLALLEAVAATLEPVLARAAGAQGRRLRFESAATAPERSVRLGFTLVGPGGGERIEGEVATDLAGLAQLAPLVRSAPTSTKPAPAGDWTDDLPVTVRLDVGWTDLPLAALAGVRAGDVLLFDECLLGPQSGIAVMAGPRLGFRGRLEAGTLTVTHPLRRTMAEPAQAGAAQAAAKASEETDAGALDEIPVRLTFDLGERVLTVAELRSLKPGFTFDLGREVRRAVTIRANGKPVGEGELVEIDGTLGVSVLSLAGQPAP